MGLECGELDRQDCVDILAVLLLVGLIRLVRRSSIIIVISNVGASLRILVEHLLNGTGLGFVGLRLLPREIDAPV